MVTRPARSASLSLISPVATVIRHSPGQNTHTRTEIHGDGWYPFCIVSLHRFFMHMPVTFVLLLNVHTEYCTWKKKWRWLVELQWHYDPPPPHTHTHTAKTKPRTEIEFVWTHAHCDYKHAHRISYRMRCNRRQQRRPTWLWIRSWIDIKQLHSVLVIFGLWTQLLAHSLFFFFACWMTRSSRWNNPPKNCKCRICCSHAVKREFLHLELSSDGRIAQW